MGFGPRHFVAPAAAFTMAVVVIFYVRSSISEARTEAHIRRAGAHRTIYQETPAESARQMKKDSDQ
ncbi:hypothetical protein K474DRAFT_1660075 [Panus rudis PR-1116 ss-1]|nr:hypothetical protein K474DRAFT_1660075 [Panus rudis PR-1116 ss-1]